MPMKAQSEAFEFAQVSQQHREQQKDFFASDGMAMKRAKDRHDLEVVKVRVVCAWSFHLLS